MEQDKRTSPPAENGSTNKTSESPESPRRLSEETIFSFALPEAVSGASKARQLIETITFKSARTKEKEKKPTPTVKEISRAAKSVGTSVAASAVRRFPLRIVLPIGSVVIVAGLATFWLTNRPAEETVSKPKSEPPSVSENKTQPKVEVIAKTTTPPPPPPPVKVAEEVKKPEPVPPPVEASPPQVQLPVASADKPTDAALGKLTKEGANTAADSTLLRYTNSTEVNSLVIAIQEASRRDNPELHKSVIALATHPDYLVRIAVIKEVATGKPYSEADRMRILTQGANDEEYLVRGFSAKALAALNNDQARQLLKERLLLEENTVVIKILEKLVL